MAKQADPSEEMGELADDLTDQLDSRPPVLTTGAFVAAALAVLVIGSLVYVVVSLAPAFGNWIDDLRTPKPEQEAVCVDPAIPNYCAAYAQEQVDRALAEASSAICPTSCEPGFVLAPDLPPDAVPNYIEWADALIQDMNEAAGVYRSLLKIMRSYGSYSEQMRYALDDSQWVTLRDDFEVRVSAIETNLLQQWSPSPSTSNNPLLDAHARLMMAYIRLDKARDAMWQAVLTDNPSPMITFGEAAIGEMQKQIGLAQTFGLGTMR